MKTKLTLAALVCLALPAAARPQEILLSVPDQPDHLKKMTEELIKLSKTKNPDAKVDLFLKLGEERTKELQKMQEQGKTTHHDALGKSYDKHVKKGAAGAIENGAAKGKDMTGACGRFDQATSHHVAVLERVLADAPPAARHGLMTALAASQHGHEMAALAHQRGKGKFGAGGPPGRQGKDNCGCDRDHYKQGLKKQGKNDQDCDRETNDHFKKVHPDGGDCHCSCDHSKGGPKGNIGGPPSKENCGFDRDHYKQGLKKKGKSDQDCDRETGDHFKKVHPDGGDCHCSCDHSKGGSKGNNGVGNGIDPQPPGNPPVNDGPGTGPGNPGNKGGPPGKGKGPGKGDSDDNDGPGKGKGPGGPPPGKGPGEDEGPGKGKGPGGPPGKGPGGEQGPGKGKGPGGPPPGKGNSGGDEDGPGKGKGEGGPPGGNGKGKGGS